MGEFERRRHGHGPVQYWDARHACDAVAAGAFIFLAMTLAGLWLRDIPLVARAVVAALTALVVYFRFD